MTFDIPTEVITPLRLESLSPSTRDNELNINAGESPIISFGVTLNTDEQINKHLAQIMIGYRHAETGVLSPRILLEYQKALWWEDSYVFQQTGDIDFKWSPSGLWMPWAEYTEQWLDENNSMNRYGLIVGPSGFNTPGPGNLISTSDFESITKISLPEPLLIRNKDSHIDTVAPLIRHVSSSLEQEGEIVYAFYQDLDDLKFVFDAVDLKDDGGPGSGLDSNSIHSWIFVSSPDPSIHEYLDTYNEYTGQTSNHLLVTHGLHTQVINQDLSTGEGKVAGSIDLSWRLSLLRENVTRPVPITVDLTGISASDSAGNIGYYFSHEFMNGQPATFSGSGFRPNGQPESLFPEDSKLGLKIVLLPDGYTGELPTWEQLIAQIDYNELVESDIKKVWQWPRLREQKKQLTMWNSVLRTQHAVIRNFLWKSCQRRYVLEQLF